MYCSNAKFTFASQVSLQDDKSLVTTFNHMNQIFKCETNSNPEMNKEHVFKNILLVVFKAKDAAIKTEEAETTFNKNSLDNMNRRIAKFSDMSKFKKRNTDKLKSGRLTDKKRDAKEPRLKYKRNLDKKRDSDEPKLKYKRIANKKRDAEEKDSIIKEA